ncbi:MAG: hypothetical protein ACREM2_11860 [Vulcanimicrobiaceae bacterium]
MSAAGLSVEQQEVLLCGDPQRIAAAVQIEIEASAPAEAAAGLRVPITFCFCPPAR